MTAHEIENETLRYLRAPGLWPNLALPMKRYVPRADRPGQPRCDVAVFCGPTTDGPWVLYLTNLCAPDFAGCERAAFSSPEAIVAAGWQVD